MLFSITLDVILKIVAYVAIGVAPMIYNYYFVKDRINKLRKAYLVKLKKYLPLLNSGQNEAKQATSSLITTLETINTTDTTTFNVSTEPIRGEGAGRVQPYIIVTQTVSHNPNATPSQDTVQTTPQPNVPYPNVPYVVFVVDLNTLRNTEELVQIISNVTSALPTFTMRVETANEG